MPFVPLPLGQRIPASPHAVSASLPTMRDIHGYEEKNPATMQHVPSAYPRFVVHPYTVRLAQHFVGKGPALGGRTLWLATSAHMADALAEFLRREIAVKGADPGQARRFEEDGLHGVSHPAAAKEVAVLAKTFLQNVGGFLSSREAEDHLLRLGLIPARHEEPVFAGDADAEIRRTLARALPECRREDVLLVNCGMNAIYTAFLASSAIQAARGRTIWVQLGWLYRDTISILQKFTAKPADYVYLRDPLDLEAVSRILTKFGPRIAGVVAELPTNPLIQTPDIAAIGALCREQGAHLIVDPSVASPFAVDVLSHSDVLIASLTKYAASEGDLLAGVLALNPAGRDAAALRKACTELYQPLYRRETARLAAQIGEAETVLAQISANAARVAAYLENHPKVREVFWTLHPASRENFKRIARRPDSIGGMITFTLRTPLEPFFDRLRLPKGPSFGMKTTLVCPFIYLAHYELATTAAGVAELAASRLDPDLVRMCVGTEPAEEIIEALAEAFG